MSQTYPMTVNPPRIKLKPKANIGELVSEAYAALSLAGIIGVLIYQIAG